MRRPAVTLAFLLAAVVGMSAATDTASAQFFWETDPPKKAKKRSANKPKPTINQAVDAAAKEAAAKETAAKNAAAGSAAGGATSQAAASGVAAGAAAGAATSAAAGTSAAGAAPAVAAGTAAGAAPAAATGTSAAGAAPAAATGSSDAGTATAAATGTAAAGDGAAASPVKTLDGTTTAMQAAPPPPAAGTSTSGEADAAREAAREAKEAAEAAKAEAAKAAAAAANAGPVPIGEVVPPAATKPDAGPAVVAAFAWLGNPANVARANKDDVTGAKVLYGERSGDGLWVGANGFSPKAMALIAEIQKADDWGLEASAFEIPPLAAGAAPEAMGEADARLTLTALKYARFARGGRVNPRSLSRIWDQDPPIKNPIEVVNALAEREDAASYLRDLHPQHPQFKRLREALLKARGPAPAAEPVDPALLVKLPKGASLKPGSEHADVTLLRQRLKVPADAGAKDTLYDPKLVEAVTAFQREKGIEAKGWLNQSTRNALNSEGEVKRPNPTRDTQRIVINMERWRWMPENLGSFYVWNNIPEYAVRVVKNDETIYREKIIVGQPSWPTPVFSADMLYVMFYPSWGMPDGIKRKELLPRLRNSGGGFFGLFGGYSSVFESYDLKVYAGGRQIDPSSVDWSSANISNYSFIQPPGPKNPLGNVKFRFPNKHDVYMHDTPERELFARSSRALSHGCIRVNNPMRFAEILIEHDRGPGSGRSSGDVTLKNPFPVHMTFFTAVADGQGRVSTFPDIYGHDSRVSSALGGGAMPYEPPPAEEAVASSEDGSVTTTSTGPARKKKKKDTFEDIIQNVFLN